jgi:hypothetical protein
MLKHLLRGDDKEPLAGDLLEEFQNGRSTGWYWRQAITAVVTGLARSTRSFGVSLVFAALWTIPEPAWRLYIRNFMAHNHLLERLWALDWPYSSISGIGVPLGLLLSSVWAGLVVYLLFSSTVRRSISVWTTIQTSVASVFVFLTATIALALLFRRHVIDLRHVTYISVITDPLQIVNRLPVFLSLLVSIRIYTPRKKRSIATMSM